MSDLIGLFRKARITVLTVKEVLSPQVYLKSCQKLKTQHFVKIVNGF